MPYQFKLEAVRRYRQFQEDQKQQELADAQRLLDQAKTVLYEQIALRSRTEEDFKRRSTENDIASQATLYRGFLGRLADEINVQRGKIQSAEKVCADKRQELFVAIQKRKALDRLKEKGEQAFLADLDSEEMKFINEMAINRFSLNNR